MGELREAVELTFAYREADPEHRKAFWGPLLRALSEQGIETDAETLLALPFDVEADAEVIEAVEP